MIIRIWPRAGGLKPRKASPTARGFTSTLLTLPLAVVLAACGGADADEGAAASKGGGTLSARPARTARAPGAIAYVGGGGRELRLVMPDGSGGRTLWRAPDTLYSVTAPAWRPDGSEIAFASDHEMAVSFYERDVYAVGADGTGLRKLTNPPAHAELARLPKGTVTVTLQNFAFGHAGPFFVYVVGAPEPQQVTLAPGSTTRLTFRDVADLGDGVEQPVVVISGINRWWDAAAAVDVKPGGSMEAALTLGASPIEHFGADAPFWSADGSRLAFLLGPTCLVNQVPADPPPGPSYEPLLDPQVFGSVCAVDWGPGGELLVVDMSPFTESGTTHVLRVKEGARAKPAPVASFDRYVRIADLRWLPDGSGFVVARQDDLVDEDINLHEFTFADRRLRKITDFTGEMVRRFSLSPDGRSIVFERVTGSIHELATLPSDLWIVGRDGSGLRPLVKDAAYPAWNPQR